MRFYKIHPTTNDRPLHISNTAFLHGTTFERISDTWDCIDRTILPFPVRCKLNYILFWLCNNICNSCTQTPNTSFEISLLVSAWLNSIVNESNCFLLQPQKVKIIYINCKDICDMNIKGIRVWFCKVRSLETIWAKYIIYSLLGFL